MPAARANVERNPERAPKAENRRRHPRIPVGLPVEVHVSGHTDAMTVELIDIAVGGVRFRTAANDVTVDQRARFMFVVAGSGACAAEGRITRINTGGEFIVELDKTSPAFRAFVSSLAV
jgi:PilZ domain